MLHLSPAVRSCQQALPHGCPAKALPPSERCRLGVQALAGTHPITDLADDHHVSRKFIYQQAATAQAALDEAFAAPEVPAERVLFYLPVTQAWLRQVILGLTLICHSSYRGVLEFCRDLLGVHLSLGTVHNVVHDAVAKAREHNRQQDLSGIDIAALDEIYQHRQPVLVGADSASSYCFLLQPAEHCDAETWGVHLLDLKEQHGLAPRATVADFGKGLRAGQDLAYPEVPCRGDVFHVLHALLPVVTYLENRAYEALAARDKLEEQKSKLQAKACRARTGQLQGLARKAFLAGQALGRAVGLADDVALLYRWWRDEVFAVSGLGAAERGELFDFLLAELQAREPQCPHRLGPVGTTLRNHREQLLAFAVQLEQDLAALAAQFQVPLGTVREVLDVEVLDERQAKRWQHQAALWQRLGQRFGPLQQAVRVVADGVVRASSVVENLNSRLRSYFFLRRHLGEDYLQLLQFFLNHRRFLRSERAERVDQSPAELLTGQSHPHWLSLLGYTPFSRN